jgi:hypothetical protein
MVEHLSPGLRVPYLFFSSIHMCIKCLGHFSPPFPLKWIFCCLLIALYMTRFLNPLAIFSLYFTSICLGWDKYLEKVSFEVPFEFQSIKDYLVLSFYSFENSNVSHKSSCKDNAKIKSPRTWATLLCYPTCEPTFQIHPPTHPHTAPQQNELYIWLLLTRFSNYSAFRILRGDIWALLVLDKSGVY